MVMIAHRMRQNGVFPREYGFEKTADVMEWNGNPGLEINVLVHDELVFYES